MALATRREWQCGEQPVGWRQFRELGAMRLVHNLERAVKLGIALFDWLRTCLLYFLE
jgi:hypothetical protein